jgi:hypothetical protein
MRYAYILPLGFIALSASPAYADCTHWDVSGDALSVNQSNGFHTTFAVQQNGEELRGRARYESFDKFIDAIGSDNGDLEGTLKGSHAEIRVHWGAVGMHPEKIGVYSMDIDGDGRVSGETYDLRGPANRVPLLGEKKVQCAQADAAAPPPRAPDTRPVARLGKKPPSKSSAPLVLFIPKSDSCAQGFVWREAGPSDKVCVPYTSRDRTAAENARASSLWTAGAYGPKTCVPGFVWREAFDGDVVCVTPDVRDQVRQENELGPSRHGQ